MDLSSTDYPELKCPKLEKNFEFDLIVDYLVLVDYSFKIF